MYRLVRPITMLALVAHLVLGCCWHHAHSNHPPDCRPAALVVSNSHDVHFTPCHDGNLGGHDGPSCPNGEQSRDAGCTAGRCVFIGSTGCSPGALVLDRNIRAFATVDFDPLDRHLSPTATCVGATLGPQVLPGRAHLLNQVFLL